MHGLRTQFQYWFQPSHGKIEFRLSLDLKRFQQLFLKDVQGHTLHVNGPSLHTKIEKKNKYLAEFRGLFLSIVM